MDELTISIVSHGHGDMLARLLSDLDACPSLQDTRVLVTLNRPDEAFQPGTYRRIRPTMIHNRVPQGFGANHNAAFRQCTSRWFAVLNPDLRLPADPFAALLADASRLIRPGVVAPRIVDSHGAAEDAVRRHPTPLSIAARVVSRRFGRAQPSQASNRDAPATPIVRRTAFYWLAGMFLLFNSDAYRGVGGFDERFFLYYEDYDICARLHQAGFAVLASHRAQAVHDAQRTSHRSMKYLKWHIRSLLRVWSSELFWALWWSHPDPTKEARTR